MSKQFIDGQLYKLSDVSFYLMAVIHSPKRHTIEFYKARWMGWHGVPDSTPNFWCVDSTPSYYTVEGTKAIKRIESNTEYCDASFLQDSGINIGNEGNNNDF